MPETRKVSIGGRLINKQIKKDLNEIGERLSLFLPGFFGKISFNFFDGKYVCSNVEQSVKPDNLKKGAKK